ncbi:cupin domain-containing protein [Candidatus Methylomirabilis sp.]|uniref:cupin domain-containing protein n=1 Tax=Candidatus Methylomirabilis sp. TaxID=2032687 RepID=UPI003C709F10
MTESHIGHERMERMLEELEGRNLLGELIQMRDEQRKLQEKAVWLIKGKELPWEINQLGKMRWYMHPRLKTPCINTLTIYVQEIPPGGRSGRMHHPGNQVMYIQEGEGYTALDGEKYYWGKGDVVQLPLRVKGVVVQHFNTSADKSARFIACEPNTFDSVGVDRGCGWEILENAPEFRK